MSVSEEWNTWCVAHRWDRLREREREREGGGERGRENNKSERERDTDREYTEHPPHNIPYRKKYWREKYLAK